jgi:peptide/nickel transport system substrate-binding protein
LVAAGVVTLAAATLTSAAASPAPSGYNAASAHVVNKSKKSGGTLRLMSAFDCDSWDPARTYYGFCWNLQRLFTRTLVGYRDVNGGSFSLAPDLATAMGRHNASDTTWSYTLQRGLRFSTGKSITPLDVKYGIERLFATDVINGGPFAYFLDTIAHPKNYAGPYRDGNLKSIHTTKRTITFHLAHPFADFDYLMALPAAAPVPYKTEGGGHYRGANYGRRPVASGPYRIKSYHPDMDVEFVRNKYWKQGTDSIRHPLVDRVTLTVDPDINDIDAKLRAGTADARADDGVTPAFAAQILTTPELKKHADDPVLGSARFMAVIPSVIPNVHCRRAIFDAFDKKAALRAFGGPTAGTIAHSLTPPGIPGHQAGYDPYPSGPHGTGMLSAARHQLSLCGKPHGFTVKFAYATPSGSGAYLFHAEKKALHRVGIEAKLVTADEATYYSTFIGSPNTLKRRHIGLALAGWGADFPTGSGFYQSIADGHNILPVGNSNYVSLNDPRVNHVLAEAGKKRVHQAGWRGLDHAVMDDAVYLPFLFQRTLYYRNPRMTNVTCNNAEAFGAYDFVNIGVRS